MYKRERGGKEKKKMGESSLSLLFYQDIKRYIQTLFLYFPPPLLSLQWSLRRERERVLLCRHLTLWHGRNHKNGLTGPSTPPSPPFSWNKIPPIQRQGIKYIRKKGQVNFFQVPAAASVGGIKCRRRRKYRISRTICLLHSCTERIKNSGGGGDGKKKKHPTEWVNDNRRWAAERDNTLSSATMMMHITWYRSGWITGRSCCWNIFKSGRAARSQNVRHVRLFFQKGFFFASQDPSFFVPFFLNKKKKKTWTELMLQDDEGSVWKETGYISLSLNDILNCYISIARLAFE